MDPRIKELIVWANQKKKVCPKLAEEIQEFVQLALDEIEDGASIQNEINLCKSDIEELINDNCN